MYTGKNAGYTGKTRYFTGRLLWRFLMQQQNIRYYNTRCDQIRGKSKNKKILSIISEIIRIFFATKNCLKLLSLFPAYRKVACQHTSYLRTYVPENLYFLEKKEF